MGSDNCLQVIGAMSALLAAAEVDDDPEALADLIAACQLVEGRANERLAGRRTEAQIDVVKDEARAALGW